mgnify:CR=1 FL=1
MIDLEDSRTGKRSYIMSCIHSKNTKIELLVRKALWSRGYRYRLYVTHIPGKPDIVFSSRKKAIFINGCFWHMHLCKKYTWPKTNSLFWRNKLEGNKKRDLLNYRKLHKIGWRYRVVWECQLESNPQKVIGSLVRFLED